MDFPDSGNTVGRCAQQDVGRTEGLGGPSATGSGERDHPHVALVGAADGIEHARRIGVGGQGQQDVAGLAARAVVVLDETNVVRHVELVPEIAQEPDYEAALATLK